MIETKVAPVVAEAPLPVIEELVGSHQKLPLPEVAPPEAELNPEPVVAVKEEEEPLGPRFAALARRERALIEREKAAKSYEQRQASLDKAIENIKKDPLTALKEVGMTFEEFATAYLNSQNPDYVPTTEEKLKEIEARLSSRETQEQQAKQQAAEQAQKAEQEYIENSISAFKDQIRNQADSQAEKYELIQANNAYDMVYEVIESYFDENKTILDPAVAMDHVEAYLEEEAKKLLKLKRFAPKSEEQPLIKDKIPDVKVNSSTTLTNNNTQYAHASDKPKGLSRDESLKRASSLIKWE